jgi:hypothetical protein
LLTFLCREKERILASMKLPSTFFFIMLYRHFTIVRNPRLSRESLVKIYWFLRFAGNHCRWKVFDSFMFQFTHKIYVIWFPFIEESKACILCAKLWDLGRVRLRSSSMYFVGHYDKLCNTWANFFFLHKNFTKKSLKIESFIFKGEKINSL